MKKNLNEAIRARYPETYPGDYDGSSRHSSHISWALDNPVEFIISHIEGWDVVLGMQYFFTSHRILDALQEKVPFVSLLLQSSEMLELGELKELKAGSIADRLYGFTEKDCFISAFNSPGDLRFPEDHWPPDEGTGNTYCDSLRLLGEKDSGKDSSGDGIFHSKSLIFCSKQIDPDNEKSDVMIQPEAVLLGSANLTQASSRNCEEVVCIVDQAMAESFWRKWARLYSFSKAFGFNCF